MKKQKKYENTRFSADVLKEALDAFLRVAPLPEKTTSVVSLEVEHDDSTWSYDHVEEFLADYRRHSSKAHLYWHNLTGGTFSVSVFDRTFKVSVEARDRVAIETVYDVFERNAVMSKLPAKPKMPMPRPTIFVGHGRGSAWRDLKDHLQEKHGFAIEAYESGARAGHSIRDILEEMANRSSFALLVLSAEDEQPDGKVRARQNVIHEAGLFQGRLGFSKAILLMEDGVEQFSNVHGVQYISFSKGNIREVFGEVLATLRREFPAT